MLRFEMSCLVAQTLEFCLTPSGLSHPLSQGCFLNEDAGWGEKKCVSCNQTPVSLTYRSRISVHFLRARDLGSFSNLSRAFSFNQEQPSLSENAHRVPVHRLEVVLGVECVRKLRPKPSETKRSLPRAISEIPRGADQTLRSPLQSSRLA